MNTREKRRPRRDGAASDRFATFRRLMVVRGEQSFAAVGSAHGFSSCNTCDFFSKSLFLRDDANCGENDAK
jgi:hypothetical protein